MKKWSLQAWDAARPCYNSILELPFIKELSAGTLSHDRFMFYINQDSLYLAEYCRILANIASRLRQNSHTAAFISFAADGVAVEKELHQVYLADKAPSGRMSTGCALYTSWLKAQALAPVEVAAAAILPCFWIYQRVGQTIYSNRRSQGNPYNAWIDCYADPAFEQNCALAIAICDELADAASARTREYMTEAFVEATRMERIFWDTAYRLEMNGI